MKDVSCKGPRSEYLRLLEGRKVPLTGCSVNYESTNLPGFARVRLRGSARLRSFMSFAKNLRAQPGSETATPQVVHLFIFAKQNLQFCCYLQHGFEVTSSNSGCAAQNSHLTESLENHPNLCINFFCTGVFVSQRVQKILMVLFRPGCLRSKFLFYHRTVAINCIVLQWHRMGYTCTWLHLQKCSFEIAKEHSP